MLKNLGLSYSLRLGRGFKTDVEKLAVEIRGMMGLKPFARLPAEELADRLGLVVLTPTDICDLPSAISDELLGNSKNRWSAVLLEDRNNGRGLIINNSTHAPARQESNIFHEISHLLCSHEPDEIVTICGLPVRMYDKEKERQAEAVAYALHISRDALFWAVKKGMSRGDICTHFRASPQLVQLRLNGTAIERVLKKKVA